MTPSQSRIFAVRCLSAVVLLVGAGLTASPAAAEGKVTVTGPEKSATVELDEVSEQPGHLRGRLQVVVSAGEVGGANAPLAVGAFLDADGDASDACTKPEAVKATLAEPVRLTSNVSTGAIIDLNLGKECADRAGTLAFSVPGNAPATLRFTLIRGVENTPEYANALLGALLAAIAAFGLMILPGRLFGDVRRDWPRVRLPIEAPFTVKDSWLTTVAAIGTLLGTVLGASNVVADRLPGISTAQFLGLNILFGAVILFAPVVYAASCSWGVPPPTPVPRGRSRQRRRLGFPLRDAPTTAKPVDRQFKAVGYGWGLVASACTTLAGVFGQLATLLVMIVSADGARPYKWFLGACLCAAAGLVALYAVRFVRGVLGAACADAAGGGAPPVRAPIRTSSAAAL